MAAFTERQKKILKLIIQEYIKKAKPISSEFLRENNDLSISTATIRIEMGKLSAQGYLWQPYTVGGRIPTDKAYRFFVNDLFEKNFFDSIDKKFLKKLKEEKIENLFKFIQRLTEVLAITSSGLVMTYLFEKDMFWREGLKKVFQEPEFRDPAFCFTFVKMIECFENEIKNFDKEEFLMPKVFIGQENLLPNTQDFSIIICRSYFSKKQPGLISILGPKRMTYKKNIRLINSVSELLK